MFEYYKWKLANKPIGQPKITLKEKEPIARKVWALLISFSVLSAFNSTIATLLNDVISTILWLITAFIFIWFVLELLQFSLQTLSRQLLKISVFLIGLIIMLGLGLGLINIMTFFVFPSSWEDGQIGNAVEFIIWLSLMAGAPVAIVTFFRFMDGRKIFAKIYRKTYLELLITILLGTAFTYFPNALVLSTLLGTNLIRFVIFAIINVGQIAGIITTLRNRGVLR